MLPPSKSLFGFYDGNHVQMDFYKARTTHWFPNNHSLSSNFLFSSVLFFPLCSWLWMMSMSNVCQTRNYRCTSVRHCKPLRNNRFLKRSGKLTFLCTVRHRRDGGKNNKKRKEDEEKCRRNALVRVLIVSRKDLSR